MFLGIHDKVKTLEKYLFDNNLKAGESLFMGDDIPDIPAMNMVHLATCPNDAVPEVRAASDYISHVPGGKGCVRCDCTNAKNSWQMGCFFEARSDSK